MTRSSAPPSCGRDESDLAGSDVLVARRRPLLCLRQVDPQLDAVEEATRDHQGLGRRLDVQDAGARRHPLRIAVRDHSPAAVRVAVLEGAVHDVGDGLEAAMRMPGRAFRLAGRVLDLPHLVHVDERVELAEIHAVERATHREAVALEPPGCARDADDSALARGRRVGTEETREDGDVVDGDRRHAAIMPR